MGQVGRLATVGRLEHLANLEGQGGRDLLDPRGLMARQGQLGLVDPEDLMEFQATMDYQGLLEMRAHRGQLGVLGRLAPRGSRAIGGRVDSLEHLGDLANKDPRATLDHLDRPVELAHRAP